MRSSRPSCWEACQRVSNARFLVRLRTYSICSKKKLTNWYKFSRVAQAAGTKVWVKQDIRKVIINLIFRVVLRLLFGF